MNDTKSVIITGGTGNIGSAVVEELLCHGYCVKVLCRSADSANKAKSMGAEPILGSLIKASTWLEELAQCDALIHTACTFDEHMGDVDYKFMQVIAKHAANRSTPLILLYTSGCWTYGSHEQVITELTPKNSLLDYQWMLESIDFLSKCKNIDLRVVSPANVVCEKTYYLPPILSWEIERCGHPTLPRGAVQTWPLVERKNLAQLYRLVFERGQSGDEYIGSAEHKAPINKLLAQRSAKKIEEYALAKWIKHYGTWTEGYSLQQVFSSNKAVGQLGWQPKKFITV
ncbi:hypothetical protein PSECIP111854_00373 [Pseudoalteromonas sp. CIP111854]|uniref:NAD-dependent epimerase/dehydratase domain-containing protein n=1 Tax=Pseudoalteromonas holothuriae TaxID=2963714 RepID=A0A9W4VR47_9GAMM|nr:NAD-dependent epimerase/dehydratase family protein [Pseudoalteromonas sp. CIP111854]CAH9049805.1 hypothetical protein PSECIP111854_00373 [Pseudoalteromonas sp. CIP111854]